MSYFNYHAKAKNLIKNDHCTQACVFENYNNISPALVLYFDNNKPMPIREYRWQEYFDLLSTKNIKIINKKYRKERKIYPKYPIFL